MALELKIAPAEVHQVHEFAGRELMCELRKTSMVLYGMFVELVREFYRFQSPYIEGAPAVKWDPDPRKTGISIDSEYMWNQDHPEFLPAIFVRLGDIQYGSLGGQGSPISAGMVLEDAVYRQVRTGATSVSFLHVGGNEGEACALCDNTRAYLSDFSMAVRRDLVLTKFHEVSATPIRQWAPDSKERWHSSSTFAVEWQEESRIKLESPVLRRVDVGPSSGDGASCAGVNSCFLNETGKYGILSCRRDSPDQHTGEYR